MQILLHESCRTDDARAEAKRATEQIGMTVSGEGTATLSARISNSEFEKLFPNQSGGKVELDVPDKLKAYVASISEAPEHFSFD